MISSCGNQADSLPSTLSISTQSDIDKYANLLEDLEVSEIAIAFENDHSYDLSVFDNLKTILRGFRVKSQEQLDAFTNLREVNDFVIDYPGHVIISNIEVVNGFFYTNNAKRVDATSLRRINSRYVLSDNVEVLGDFSNLEYINEILMQYDELRVIEDFSKLEEVINFNLFNSDIEILPNAFTSLRHIEEFQFFCFNNDADIDISWLKEIESCKHFDLHGPFEKNDICEYIYPIRNNVSGFFQVSPSEALLESIGKTRALDLAEVTALCE